MTRNLPTSAARIDEDISALAAITEPDRPYTRRAFTPMFLKGRDWLAQRFQAAGLTTHIDSAGNLIGSRKGNKPSLGTIMLGSHSDTVPDGGRYEPAQCDDSLHGRAKVLEPLERVGKLVAKAQ
mgnify:CR=1 FL=1